MTFTFVFYLRFVAVLYKVYSKEDLGKREIKLCCRCKMFLNGPQGGDCNKHIQYSLYEGAPLLVFWNMNNTALLKKFSDFLSPVGMQLTKLSLAGLFPARESLVSDTFSYSVESPHFTCGNDTGESHEGDSL